MNADTRKRLRDIWYQIRQRCCNPQNPKFKTYGARGISLCDRWYDFEAFVEDMGPTYVRGLTISRKGDQGNYEPGNCTWATKSANSAESAVRRSSETSDANRRRFANPANRKKASEKQSAIMLERWSNDDDGRQKLAEAMRLRSVEMHAGRTAEERSEIARKAWETRRAKLAQII